MNALFLYCRAGFENDCAAEIIAQAARHDISGYCKAKSGSGYVIFSVSDNSPIATLFHQLSIVELIFCRQWFVIQDMRNDLPAGDRISPLLEIVRLIPHRIDRIMVDTTDTNEGKQLSPLCRKLSPLIAKQLKLSGDTTGVKNEISATLHICFLSTHAAYVGYSTADNAEPWLMGVPRLKFPHNAPSRSTLKLEEALLRLLTENEKQQLLKSGMRAVDLGAAPGGWTWILVKRHMYVTAVDNGSMQATLLETGLVEHIRADGFTYQPDQPVEWLVCDIIDRPQRVIERMAIWLISGWCKQAIFNLKLPMKQRYQHTVEYLRYLEDQLEQHKLTYRLTCKQLYHDREEVTVFVRTY